MPTSSPLFVKALNKIVVLESQLLETRLALSEREADAKAYLEVARLCRKRTKRINKENREINIRLRQTHQERDEALDRETAHEARIEELEEIIRRVDIAWSTGELQCNVANGRWWGAISDLQKALEEQEDESN